MSASISQIGYWREVKQPNQVNQTNELKLNASEGGPGASYLSYNVFLGLSVIGGLLALDHLYLRSPLTFLAKIVINLLFFGAWWLYDASQAIFNRDVIKVFGLSVPGIGPKGIGAGVLASDVPDKKHMSFFIYGLAVLFGGLFGLDSFIVGDKQYGFVRLISLFSILLVPVAIGWWLFSMFKFFFKTQDVIEKHWEYFGAPPPPDVVTAYEESILEKLPLVGGLFKTLFGILSPSITQTIKPIIKESIEPIKNTVNSGLEVIQTSLETVQDGLELGKEALATGVTIADKTLNVVGQTADAATKALSIAPATAAMTTGFTANVAQKALNTLSTQKGGVAIETTLPLLSYILITTIAGIAVSGIIITYRRSRQNAKPRKDDSPPEPGVLRELDKKESTTSP